MNTHFYKHTKGFTIVETLVAVTILMIAVAGPMVAASRSLNAALYARDQMTATFLAQETMEVIKANRSNALYTSGPSSWPTPGYASCIGSSEMCDVSALDPLMTCLSEAECTVSTIDNIYSRYGNGAGMKFQRYFYLESVANPVGSLDVHVFVKWMQGLIPYEMELISQLSDQER